jgi:hypothetical protein
VTPLEKAAVIDEHALRVVTHFQQLVKDHDWWAEILAVARARHILGHYEYGDTNLFEWSDGKVRAAIIEELADAVVYQAWLEERKARGE